MSEKKITARIQQKHDLEKNWLLAENFIPKIGELIVYDAETSVEDITDKNGNLIRENICEYSRLKIGDGVTTVGNLAFADDDLRKELERYVLKEEQATIKGKGLDSTQLHTGPVQALGKYQVVAGMYNEPDPIAKYKEETFWGVHGLSGQDIMANYIKVTPPIFDSVNGIFKANIMLEGSSWEPGDNYIRRENIEYQPDQEVTFVEYYIYEDVRNFEGIKIKDNTQKLGKYAIIVGNGDSEDLRSNAYTLDWKGNASFSGKVFVEKTEELAKLSNVPHFYEEKNYSTEAPVIFSVQEEAYLNYETPWYIIGTEPFTPFENEAIYCVSIDGEKYYAISNGSILSTVEDTSNLANQGDFIILDWYTFSFSDEVPTKVCRKIFLPGTTQEENLITITKVNKSMVPEEIIPETVARKTDILQSDWNQNDETATDFVKNRTHYIDSGVLLIESSAEKINDETFGSYYMINRAPHLYPGEKYTIIYNNRSYRCTAQIVSENPIDDSEAIALGNLSFIGGNDTGQDFLIGISQLRNVTVIIDSLGEEFQKLIIEGYGLVHTLDEKFLPESYRELINTTKELSSQVEENTVNISTLDNNTLKTIQQSLTESQKIQARKNIGAISLNDVPAQAQANLSETDENDFSYVNGILQERHLPGFLPTSPNYDDGSNYSEPIIEIDFDETRWDEANEIYTIFSLDTEGEREQAASFLEVLYSINGIPCLTIEENNNICLSNCSLVDSAYLHYTNEDNTYALSTIYGATFLRLPGRFTHLKICVISPQLDGVHRLLNVDTLPVQVVKRPELYKAIANKADKPFIINFTSVAPYCDKTIQEIAEAYNNNQNIEAYMIDGEVGKIHLSLAYTDTNVTAITPWIYSNGNAKSCQFVYDETNSEWIYNPILLSESFTIDYESTLAFDTSEIVIGQSTTSILGQAILGKMILG